MSEEPKDVVRDILDRLHTAMREGTPLDDTWWGQLESEIRRDWGGQRPYIPKGGRSIDTILGEAIRRDREICTAYHRDKLSISAISEKYGLSRITIWRKVTGRR